MTPAAETTNLFETRNPPIVALSANHQDELGVCDPPHHPGGPALWWRYNPLVEFAVDAFAAKARGEFSHALLVSDRIVAVANENWH